MMSSFSEPPQAAQTNRDETRGGYRLIAKLGSGGMADVFLGVQFGEQDFRRLVVIKKIHARGLNLKNVDAIKMFIDEARTVASLNHPHIVKIFDLNRLRNDVIITMEYIDGETLAFIIKTIAKSGRKLPLPITCRLISQACEALQYAHSATTPEGQPLGLVHRDIDTQNLMIDSNGYIKLIDFGVAKTDAQTELTAPGMFKGKLSYVAPDVFKFKQVDHRVDLYSLGLVFYSMVTMKKPFPFQGDVTVAEVIERVLKEQLPPPSSIDRTLPKELDVIVGRATHKDRDQRFQSGEDFGEAISRFAEKHEGLASTAEVKRWFQDQFSSRIEQRREFERKALKKAQATMGKGESNPFEESKVELRASAEGLKVSLVDSASVPLGGDPQTVSNVDSGVPVVPSGVNSYPTMAQRRTNPYILMLVGFGLIAAAILVVYVLFFRFPSQQQSTGVVTVTSVGDSEDNLQVTSVPQGAELFVDGQSYGNIGPTGVSLRVEPKTLHTIKVVKQGFEVYELTFPGDAHSRRKVEAFLVATIEPKPSAPATAKAAAISDNPLQDTPHPPKTAWKIPQRKPSSPRMAIALPENDTTADEVALDTPVVDTTTKESVQEPLKEPTTTGSQAPSRRSSSKKSSSVSHRQEAEVEPAPKPQDAAATPAPSPETRSIEKEETAAVAKAAASDRRSQREENQYFSGDGGWSGAEVFGRGCGRCHNGGKAMKLIPSRKTKTEWRYFFDRRLHRRYARLEKYFSAEELDRCLNHILQRTF
jgi:serine/threonine protein kinase